MSKNYKCVDLVHIGTGECVERLNTSHLTVKDHLTFLNSVKCNTETYKVKGHTNSSEKWCESLGLGEGSLLTKYWERYHGR